MQFNLIALPRRYRLLRGKRQGKVLSILETWSHYYFARPCLTLKGAEETLWTHAE